MPSLAATSANCPNSAGFEMWLFNALLVARNQIAILLG